MRFSNPHKAWDADDKPTVPGMQFYLQTFHSFIMSAAYLLCACVCCLQSCFSGLASCTRGRPAPSLFTTFYSLLPSRALLLCLLLLSLHHQLSILLISISLQTCYSSILSKAVSDPMDPSTYYPISFPLCRETLQNHCLYISLLFFLSSNPLLKLLIKVSPHNSTKNVLIEVLTSM